MSCDIPSRLAIIGNSGSSKTTLAKTLARTSGLPIHHLDPIHWERYGVKRDPSDAKTLVAEIAATDSWIIEGVFGWLIEVALSRATGLIWLDLSWNDCRDGLLHRGLAHEETTGGQRELLVWAGDYWTRTSSSSFAGHSALFENFTGWKLLIRSRDEADRWAARRFSNLTPRRV